MNLSTLHEDLLKKIEDTITDFLTLDTENRIYESTLLEAMRYSTLNGGKRLRPLTTIAIGNIFNVDLKVTLYLGAVIELLHCFSLIHDDLPAMDNDDIRRGIPTCHKKYTEAIAILAGDALQSLAFELLTSENFNVDDTKKIKISNLIAQSIGKDGMAGGQAMDITYTNTSPNLENLTKMHNMKTAALFKGAIISAYFACDTYNLHTLNKLNSIAKNIGLLFQIIDDLLDNLSSNVLGKTTDKDIKNGKATFVTVYGSNKAREIADQIYQDLKKQIVEFTNTEFLMYLIDIIYKRNF